uniref:F-box domain-containing protein n=1 Tax=Graphocephala atropunctata TaxID=36148 RepID=A0A1B6LV09_9HEMI
MTGETRSGLEHRKLSSASVEEWSREWKKFKCSLLPMDITQLPIFVLEDITYYLRGCDLAACATVCYPWRDAFNDDFFWRRLCYRDIVPYLAAVDNHVKPHFQLPPQDSDTLEELCEWRICFMRQAHLMRNWYCARYSLQTIYTYDSTISHSGHVLHDTGDHWLVLSTRSKTQVWNIQDVPYMEAAVVNYGESFVAGVGPLMLRASHNLLEVFKPDNLLAPQNNPKFDINLTFACFIDTGEKLPNTVETTSDVTKVIAKSHDYDFKNPFDYFTIGNIFVGYQPAPSRLWSRPRIHFWDLTTGVKVHEEAVPRICSQCIVMKGDTAKPAILIYAFKSSTFKNRNIRLSHIYLYNIKTMSYTGFHADIPSKVLWWGMARNVLVTRQERAFHFFDVVAGTFLSVKDMDLKMNVGESDLEHSQFLLRTHLYYAYKYHLQVMDIETQEMVFMFDLNYIIYSLHNVRGKFMIISSKSCSEVWDIDDNELVFKLPYLFITDFKIDSQASPMRLLAQSQNEVSIINFW